MTSKPSPRRSHSGKRASGARRGSRLADLPGEAPSLARTWGGPIPDYDMSSPSDKKQTAEQTLESRRTSMLKATLMATRGQASNFEFEFKPEKLELPLWLYDDPDEVPVLLAAFIMPSKQINITSLVEGKADVNCRLEEPWDHSVVDFDSPLGARPVHFAALRGMMQELQLLLDNGADVNSQTYAGHTPLMVAAMFSRMDVLRLLLEASADALIQDEAGLSAVDMAILEGRTDVVNLMLQMEAAGEEKRERDMVTQAVSTLEKLRGSDGGDKQDSRGESKHDSKLSPDDKKKQFGTKLSPKAKATGRSASNSKTR